MNRETNYLGNPNVRGADVEHPWTKDELKFGDLKAVEDLYEVTVYAGEKEEYKTYCTPEAREALDEYLNTRRDGKEYTTNYPMRDKGYKTKRITKKFPS